ATHDATGEIETSHAAGRLGTFTIRVEVSDGRTTVTLRKAAATPPVPPDGPAPRATTESRAETAITSGAPVEHPPHPIERDEGLLGAVLDQAIARHASDILLS